MEGNRTQNLGSKRLDNSQMTSSKPIADWILDGLKIMGVDSIIFSPGSRNAPFIIAASARIDFKLRVVLDERSAAFQALGEIEALGRPVAVCCTSGSAIANYHPAVLEAFYSKLPLIVISADRPASRIDKGEGQSCRQMDFFNPHIGASISVQEDIRKLALEESLAFLSQQVLDKRAPVHINVGFQEPLYDLMPKKTTMNFRVEHALHEIDLTGALYGLSQCDSIAVIFGQLSHEQSLKMREDISSGKYSFTCFVDPLSGLLDLPDTRPISELLSFAPQGIISIGGQWIDKAPKFHLRALHLKVHVHLDFYQSWDVTDASEFIHIALDQFPEEFELRLSEQLIKTSSAEKDYNGVELPWSDALVFKNALHHISDWSHLHLANSTAVRYFSFFNRPVNLYANRGISGIDGSLSTAIGASLARQKERHFCIIGDQSFIYDSNALNLSSLPSNLTIIILNNSIGAIFDWLPGNRALSSETQRLFANEQKVNFESLCSGFGVSYICVTDQQELTNAMAEQVSGTLVIEARTMDADNTAAYELLKRT